MYVCLSIKENKDAWIAMHFVRTSAELKMMSITYKIFWWISVGLQFEEIHSAVQLLYIITI